MSDQCDERSRPSLAAHGRRSVAVRRANARRRSSTSSYHADDRSEYLADGHTGEKG